MKVEWLVRCCMSVEYVGFAFAFAFTELCMLVCGSCDIAHMLMCGVVSLC